MTILLVMLIFVIVLFFGFIVGEYRKEKNAVKTGTIEKEKNAVETGTIELFGKTYALSEIQVDRQVKFRKETEPPAPKGSDLHTAVETIVRHCQSTGKCHECELHEICETPLYEWGTKYINTKS